MVWRALPVLTLLAAPVSADPPAGRDLTGAEQRMLDGAYLYLVSPEYCDPALPADRLRAWVAVQIRGHAIAPQDAAGYLSENEPRLRLVADAAFGGRRGTEVCQAIFALRESTPELRPPD